MRAATSLEQSDVEEFERAKVEMSDATHDDDRRRANVEETKLVERSSCRSLLPSPGLFDDRDRRRGVETAIDQLLCDTPTVFNAHQDHERQLGVREGTKVSEVAFGPSS